VLDNKPYVGVTGVMWRRETVEILKVIDPNSFDSHQFMVGVLVNSLTLKDKDQLFPGRYPIRWNLTEIFTNDPRCLNILHFYTTCKKFSDQMFAFLELAGKHCHGFQLNFPHPDREQLEKYLNNTSAKRIILQIGRDIFREYDFNLEQIFTYTKQYEDVITDVLFDLSGGTGEFLNVPLAHQFLQRFTNAFDKPINCGIAGGLRIDRISEIYELLHEFPNTSLDAEGQLRTPQSDPVNNKLNTMCAHAYVTGTLSIINHAQNLKPVLAAI